jgi:hypothetical protein
VRHVFGVPGGQTLALYDAILDRDPDLRHVLARSGMRPVSSLPWRNWASRSP